MFRFLSNCMAYFFGISGIFFKFHAHLLLKMIDREARNPNIHTYLGDYFPTYKRRSLGVRPSIHHPMAILHQTYHPGTSGQGYTDLLFPLYALYFYDGDRIISHIQWPLFLLRISRGKSHIDILFSSPLPIYSVHQYHILHRQHP